MTYPGGKNGSGVYQKIINLMPPHERYFEPFLGGGAILRLKRPAALNVGLDLVASALSAVSAELAKKSDSRSHTAESGERCRCPSSAKAVLPVAAPLLAMQSFSAENGGTRVPVVLAVGPYHLFQRCGIRALESEAFTPRDLIYCDPPYMMSTRSGRPMYEYEMPDVDHRRLLRCLLEVPAMVMISGYWSKLYADKLKGWNSIHFEAMTRGGLATEWLWFNFPVPTELHDYGYLGEGYRERERIARKKRRWVNRLRIMPRLERQALLSAIADTGIPGDGSSPLRKYQDDPRCFSHLAQMGRLTHNQSMVIKQSRISTGKARAEGREPSHDGEYITIYYTPGNTSEIIAEHNAGTFNLDDCGLDVDGLPEEEEEALRAEWDEIRASARQIAGEDQGEFIQPQYAVGSEAKSEMIALGWATEGEFDGNHYNGER